MTIKAWKGKQPDLTEDGATAIHLSAPTNPNANLGTTLAESVREGVPSLPGIQGWKRRTEVARAAASEFLNAEFGWLPLVHEVKQTAKTVRDSRTILSQFSRDSGRSVRREFSFPAESSVSTRILGEFQPASQPFGADGWPSFFRSTGNGYGPLVLTQTIKVTSKRWFSGCFTYALPSQSDSWGGIHRNAAEADKLFGISITPDVLWELTPWSWAVDWFSNAGDVIANVNNFALQGLVMRYGYMMHENVIEIVNTFQPSNQWHGLSFPSSRKIISSKRRVEANPFGFGIGWQDLSPTQLAIAAAVGITHLL